MVGFAAAPGVPLVRAVPGDLTARSLSDGLEMTNAVPGVQINRTRDIAGLALNMKRRIAALRSRPGPGPNTNVRLGDCTLKAFDKMAWLFHSILGRAGSRQRLASRLQSQRPRSARRF